MAAKKSTGASAKANVKKRTLNPTGSVGGGAPMNEQDPKRRMGNFEGAGEHPHVGGRTSGIVGQTKQKFTTDKKSK